MGVPAASRTPAITPADNTRERLAALAKLATLGELVPAAAHDVNNPLFASITLTDLLADDIAPGSAAHERLVLIQGSLASIKETIGALVAFARDDDDERRIVSLGDVTRDALALFRGVGGARHLELVDDCADEVCLVDVVVRDVTQIVVQILIELRRALPDGGTVEVAVRADGGDAVVSATARGSRRHPDPRLAALSLATALAETYGGSVELDARDGAALALRLPRAVDR